MRGVFKRGASQLSVLAALATFTVAVPLTGFVGVDTSLSIPGRDIVVADNESSSWAYDEDAVEDTASAEAVNDAAAAPAALASTNDAEARARIVEAEKNPVPGCEAKTAARGEASVYGAINEEAIHYPLPAGSFRMVSPFGYRVHPILRVGRLHAGIDLSAPRMTPVYAAAPGKVTFVGPWGGGGNIVRIEHDVNGEQFITQYLHLSSGSYLVKEGDTVTTGQHIAGVGSTGTSTGNHLHFEVRLGMDNPIDSWKWLKDHHAVYVGQDSC